MVRPSFCAALVAAVCLSSAAARAASFNYHGNLQDAGKPAEGNYDLELTLYSAAEGGRLLAGPLLMYQVPVHDGSFSTEADFGPLSNASSQHWLSVKVRNAGKGEFAALAARAPLGVDATATNSSCPGSWSLDGNAGNIAGSYLGTADAKDVVIKSNAHAVLLAPAASPFAVVLSGALGPTGGIYSTAVSNAFQAAGNYSFAGGYSAGTANDGSFVWGDHTSHKITDSGVNQFIVQAGGGVGINTANGPNGTETLAGAELTIRSTLGNQFPASINLLAQNGDASEFRGFSIVSDPQSTPAQLFGGFRLQGIFNHSGVETYEPIMTANFGPTGSSTVGNSLIAFNRSDTRSDAAILVGTNTSNGNGAYLTTGGVWTDASSRTFKEAFAMVDPLEILTKVIAIPVTTWFYKNDHGEGRHMGPMAEDFSATFGLGNDDTHIGTVDESGVALAAIQGLNEKLEAENDDLRARLDDVLGRLERLESREMNRLQSKGE